MNDLYFPSPSYECAIAFAALAALFSLIVALLLRRAAAAVRAREAADQARDAVLAVVSHDLRNHFGAISLSAAALTRQLAQQGGSRTSTETANRIQRAVRQADGLIVDLVEMANVHADVLRLDRRSHGVDSILHDAVEVASLLSDAKSIVLETRIETTRRLLCDRTRALQVLSNILGNAIKFTPEGGRVSVSARDEGPMVVVSVTDTGPGMACDELPRVFERYWKGARAGAGTGLGLYIAKSLVAAHGGTVRASSRAGEGATFAFTLPAEAEPGAAAVPAVAAR